MLLSRFPYRRLAWLAQHHSTQALAPRSSALFPSIVQLLRPTDLSLPLASPCQLSRNYATIRKTTKSTRKTTKTNSKPKPKPKKKAPAKKKPATKSAKTKSRPKSKKSLTPNQILSAKVTSLRKVALLGAPKSRPQTTWMLYFQQHVTPGTLIRKQVKNISRQYRTLSASERESLNQTAINNKLLAQREYADWVRSHTPDQIRLANNARLRLNKLSGQRHQNSNHRYTKRFVLLKDDRLLKRPRSGYLQYAADRWATGDFKNTRMTEASREISRGWKDLNENDRKKYNDAANVRREQYLTERAELYPSIAKPPVRHQRASSSETIGR